MESARNMKAKGKSSLDLNPPHPLVRSITLAQVEAAIGYWRREQARRRRYDADPAPGGRQTAALEQLYGRLLTARQGAVWSAQLSTYEYEALQGGLPELGG